jgi:uncharacterized membrane protein YhhN
MMGSTIFLPLIFTSVSLTIYGEMTTPARRGLIYVFKPLTTTLIIMLAALLPGDPAGRYRLAILLGLGLSLLGDVFLMLPGDRFVPGLAAFLMAHLCYLVAFMAKAPFGGLPGAFVPFAAAVAPILILAWPKLQPQMRIPVVAYAVILGAMAGQALTLAVVDPVPPAFSAAAGAALFVLSDSALVVNRFVQSFRLSPLVVLATYYAAQTLIALSVAFVTP